MALLRQAGVAYSAHWSPSASIPQQNSYPRAETVCAGFRRSPPESMAVEDAGRCRRIAILECSCVLKDLQMTLGGDAWCSSWRGATRFYNLKCTLNDCFSKQLLGSGYSRGLEMPWSPRIGSLCVFVICLNGECCNTASHGSLSARLLRYSRQVSRRIWSGWTLLGASRRFASVRNARV